MNLRHRPSDFGLVLSSTSSIHSSWLPSGFFTCESKLSSVTGAAWRTVSEWRLVCKNYCRLLIAYNIRAETYAGRGLDFPRYNTNAIPMITTCQNFSPDVTDRHETLHCQHWCTSSDVSRDGKPVCCVDVFRRKSQKMLASGFDVSRRSMLNSMPS